MKTISLLGAGGFIGNHVRQAIAGQPTLLLQPSGAEVIIDVCGPGDPRDFSDLSDVGENLREWSGKMSEAICRAKAPVHVIHLSTMDLDFPPDVPQLYLVYKTLQRDFLRVWIETHGISLTILETSCVYGLEMTSTRFLSLAVRAAKDNRPIKAFSKAGVPSERPWTSVSHLAQALVSLAKKEKPSSKEEILQYFSFQADSRWIAKRIVNLLGSSS